MVDAMYMPWLFWKTASWAQQVVMEGPPLEAGVPDGGYESLKM